jgi:hypothetical protein
VLLDRNRVLPNAAVLRPLYAYAPSESAFEWATHLARCDGRTAHRVVVDRRLAMAHKHNTECEQLREMLEALNARKAVEPDRALPDGTILPPVDLEEAALAAAPSLATPDTDLDHEIANVRQALADIGCER